MQDKEKILPEKNIEHFTGELPANGQEKTATDIFRSTVLDQNIDYPEPDYVVSLKYNESVYKLLSKKAFSLFQGKQKSKKSLLLAIMAAGIIRNTIGHEDIDFVSEGNGVVLWFDCEQGKSYAARTMKLILKLANLDRCDRLVYSEIREYTPKERMDIILAGIESTKDVSLVIIDGIVDLMNDFMDAKEGHFVITQLLMWCSIHNVHIAGVLHQNKADTNARAHVGSIGSQKCELEFSTKVDPDDKARTIIECVNARGLPFESFAIRWDKGQLPRIDAEWQTGQSKQEVRSQKDYDNSKEIVKAIFKPLKSYSFTDAIEGIMNAVKRSEPTAKRYLKQYTVWGLIEKGSDGNYRIKL